MRAILNSTTKIVKINGIKTRVWEGISESGIKMHAYIALVGIDKNEKNTEQFDRELEQMQDPSVDIDRIPPAMII